MQQVVSSTEHLLLYVREKAICFPRKWIAFGCNATKKYRFKVGMPCVHASYIKPLLQKNKCFHL